MQRSLQMTKRLRNCVKFKGRIQDLLANFASLFLSGIEHINSTEQKSYITRPFRGISYVNFLKFPKCGLSNMFSPILFYSLHIFLSFFHNFVYMLCLKSGLVDEDNYT
jgi:hypothetical protein